MLGGLGKPRLSRHMTLASPELVPSSVEMRHQSPMAYLSSALQWTGRQRQLFVPGLCLLSRLRVYLGVWAAFGVGCLCVNKPCSMSLPCSSSPAPARLRLARDGDHGRHWCVGRSPWPFCIRDCTRPSTERYKVGTQLNYSTRPALLTGGQAT